MAQQLGVTIRSFIDTPRQDTCDAIDASPRSIHGVLIGTALALPFWAVVITLAVRLVTGR